MAARKKRVKVGTLEFDAHNGINFIVDSDPTADDEGSYMLDWASTPAEMAKNLREAAEWLEQHASDTIRADID